MSTPIIDEYGTKWYYNEQGQLHRTDGPAVEYANGDKSWWVNDQRHRTDGPAVEYANGDKEWWVNCQLHRPDGPAIEYASGTKSWWVNGKCLTEAEFNAQYGQQQPSLEGATITINGIDYILNRK